MSQSKRTAKRKSAAKPPPEPERTTASETGPSDPEVTEGVAQVIDSDKPKLADYQPRHRPLTKVDQHAAHKEQQAELARERETHNQRTRGFKF